jgi:hypothetical protein
VLTTSVLPVCETTVEPTSKLAEAGPSLPGLGAHRASNRRWLQSRCPATTGSLIRVVGHRGHAQLREVTAELHPGSKPLPCPHGDPAHLLQALQRHEHLSLRDSARGEPPDQRVRHRQVHEQLASGQILADLVRPAIHRECGERVPAERDVDVVARQVVDGRRRLDRIELDRPVLRRRSLVVIEGAHDEEPCLRPRTGPNHSRPS